MERTLFLGQQVTLQKDLIKDKKGAIGYVYEEYGDTSVSVIFENGSYDGFSPEEQMWLLEGKKISSLYSSYEFKNVNQVAKDYSDGYWNFRLIV